MPLPNDTLIAKFFVNAHDGHQWTSSLYYQPAVPFIIGHDMVLLANSFQDFFEHDLQGVLSEEATIVGWYVRYKNAGVDLEGYSTGDPATGDVSGEELPIQDCIEIRRLTGKPGRSKRGRIFLSSISEESIIDNHIVSGHRASFQQLASHMAQDLTFAETLHARHWDRKNNVMEPVTTCKPVVRTVSRRDRERYLPYQAI